MAHKHAALIYGYVLVGDYAWRQVYCGVFEAEYQGVTFWFVDNEYYFKRWQLYGHFDDCERYAYFSRAVVETPGQLGWSPDVIHCNDWQTALVPVYLLASASPPVLMKGAASEVAKRIFIISPLFLFGILLQTPSL